MDDKVFANPKGSNQFLIVYQDVFHLKSLYITMYDWLQENGWTSAEPWEVKKGEGDDKPETMFYSNLSPGNRKLWIWWRLQKKADNSFYQYFMNIEFMMLGMKDEEGINRDGTKFKGQLGELTIFIKPWFEMDFQNKFKNTPVLGMFYDFYKNRIILQDALKREEMMVKDTYRFIGVIKKFLEQKTFIPDQEIMYEPRRKYG
jgi:hypothetical protein